MLWDLSFKFILSLFICCGKCSSRAGPRRIKNVERKMCCYLTFLSQMPNKCRPLIVQFEKENAKAKILGKFYLLKSMEPYSNVYVSVDMTKSERIKHKQLVDELKSRQAKGETNIFIRSNSIITKFRTKTRSSSNTDSATRVSLMESSSWWIWYIQYNFFWYWYQCSKFKFIRFRCWWRSYWRFFNRQL